MQIHVTYSHYLSPIVSLDPPSKNNALLLTTNTEVSIAPKLRSSQQTSSKKSTAPTSTTTNDPPKPKLPSKTLRVIPPHVLPPQTFPLPTEGYTSADALAYVSQRTWAGLTNTPYPLPQTAASDRQFYKTALAKLKPPPNPVESDAAAPIPEPVAKILNAGGSEKVDEKGDGKKKETSVWVGWADGVTESHVAFPVGVEGVGEWDLVR